MHTVTTGVLKVKVYFRMHLSLYLKAEKGDTLLKMTIRENNSALISSSPALLTHAAA